jgi:hypothetical protein
LENATNAVLSAFASAQSDAADHLEPEPLTVDGLPSQTQVRFQQGRVKLLHRTDVIADLAPATVTVLAEGRALREATFQLGGEDSREPSLSLTFNRTHEPWQVDLDAAALPLRQLAPWIPAIPWHGTDNGRAHARVHVEPIDSAERLDVSGDFFIEDFGLQHTGLAREPIDGLSVSLDGRAVVDLDRRRVTTAGLNWHVNGVPFSVSGWAEHNRQHTALDVGVHVPAVTCDGALRALPHAITGIASGFVLSGVIGANAHVALDTEHLPATVFDYNIADGCNVAQAAYALSVRRFSQPFVQRVNEPGGHIRAFVTGPGSAAWTPIEEIHPSVVNAVISREDGSFMRHRGFSPQEIRGALVRNINDGRFAYGASTISMQLVKNVFLAREKTLVRKLQEVVLTWWIEQSLTKQAIIELYLNVVEFGPGIYGIGPASHFFFNREPRELSPLQAIYLATLLPAPVPRFAIYQRQTPSPETLARLRSIARSMTTTRMMSLGDAAAAQSESLHFRPRDTPIRGAQTLTVDPSTTDQAARALSAQAAVRVTDTPQEPTETQPETPSPPPPEDPANP